MPSVMIDGRSFTPPGWLWVLAFAVAGCPWAVEEASRPSFRARIQEYLVHERQTALEDSLRQALADVDRLKAELSRMPERTAQSPQEEAQ